MGRGLTSGVRPGGSVPFPPGKEGRGRDREGVGGRKKGIGGPAEASERALVFSFRT